MRMSRTDNGRCSLCGTIAPLFCNSAIFCSDFAVLCRPCFNNVAGRQPSPSMLTPTMHLPNESKENESKETSKDGPWLPWPKFTREAAASESHATLGLITSAIKDWIETGKIGDFGDLGLAGLCALSAECLPWLHAETMIDLSLVLLNLARTQQEIKVSRNLFRRILRVSRRQAQPCHGSDYVGLATELQLIGLAHGDFALRQKAKAYAATIRSGDLCTAAEVLWTFLTAKAVEIPVLEALESLEVVEDGSLDAVAAILCGLSQPQVIAMLDAEHLVRLVEHFAGPLLKGISMEGVTALPPQTLSRLALSLSDLLQGKSISIPMPNTTEAFQVILQKGLQILGNFTLEELSDLAVAAALGFHGCHHHGLMAPGGPFVAALTARLDGTTQEPCRLVPGAAVKVRKNPNWEFHVDRKEGNSGNSQGVLSEFYLARGQWRVWLEGLEGRCVDVREEGLELLDAGLRPQRCCNNCWRLSRQLSEPGGSLPELCQT